MVDCPLLSINLSCKFMSFRVSPEPFLVMHSHFLISLNMQLLWQVLVLTVWLPRGESGT